MRSLLTLAAHGISIFPAVVKGQGSKWAKIPLVDNWQDAATTDDRKIIEWWVQFPHAVPGIELNRAGLVVIDADRHGDGPDGVAALQELAARYQSEGGLPAGPLSLTAGGGQHHIYRQPNGEQPLGNRRGSLPPGIDVRGRADHCRPALMCAVAWMDCRARLRASGRQLMEACAYDIVAGRGIQVGNHPDHSRVARHSHPLVEAGVPRQRLASPSIFVDGEPRGRLCSPGVASNGAGSSAHSEWWSE